MAVCSDLFFLLRSQMTLRPQTDRDKQEQQKQYENDCDQNQQYDSDPLYYRKNPASRTLRAMGTA